MSGSALNAVVAQGYNYDPSQFIGNWIDVGRKQTALQQAQFDLGQAKLGPVYSAMRMLQATNPNPTDDDIKNAIAQGARNNGNIDPMVANYADWRARGGSPADFLRAQSLGGMTPAQQYSQTGPQFQARATDQGTWYGNVGGPATPNANVFTPTQFVGRGLAPATQTSTMVVGYDASGRPITQSVGAAYGDPYGGAGGGGAGAAAIGGAPGAVAGGGRGVGGSALLPPGAPDNVAAARIDQIGMRESGNRNIPTGIKNPDGTPASTASGPYQFLDSTWQQAAREYGIQNPTPRAMDTDPSIQRAVAIRFLQNHGEQPWATSAPGGGGAVASGPAPGPFVGATAAQPVPGGGGMVRPAGGGGVSYLPPSPGGGATYLPPSPGGGAGGAAPGSLLGPNQSFTGLPLGAAEVAAGNIRRQQGLADQMNAATNQRATLEGMEAELYKMPPTGVASGAVATIKNFLVQSGMLGQAELDRQAQGLSAQEQFDKFSAMLNGQLLAGMGGQATDARQALTGAATPSSVHSTLGNMGIIHMLEGNLIATQVLGREFQAAVQRGDATPQNFDAWRDNFTKPSADGRFDPRVFWLSAMRPNEQASYIRSLTEKDKDQLHRNANYAASHGWVSENKDGSMGTNY